MSAATSDSYASNLYTDALAASEERKTRGISFSRMVTVCRLIVDFFTCATMTLAVSMLRPRFTNSSFTYPFHKILEISVASALFAIVLLQREGIYNEWASIDPIRETTGAIRMSVQSLLLILPTCFLFRSDVAFAIAVPTFMLIPLVLVLQKHVFTSMVWGLQKRGHGLKRVVIYGTKEKGWHIASKLLLSSRLGLCPVAVIDEEAGSINTCSSELTYSEHQTVPIQRISLTTDLLKSFRCSLLIAAISNPSSERFKVISDIARKNNLPTAYVFDRSLQGEQEKAIDLDGLKLMYETVTPWYYIFEKRAMDLMVSLIFLVLLSPFFIIIAILIRLNSNGPALFVQKRVGLNGVLFNMYKFRSMSCHVRKYERSPTTSNDPRITKIGKFLRRTSLDELPQLINVFLGQMSLVGPRPEMPFIVKRYSAYQQQRLQVTPGITGPWQLSPDRAHPIHENIHHDLSYIRNRTLYMDLAILIHTMFFAMRGGI
jgi:exopolysaccharide biosynthesis polyprenyl glycosylphosphotransferase